MQSIALSCLMVLRKPSFTVSLSTRVSNGASRIFVKLFAHFLPIIPLFYLKVSDVCGKKLYILCINYAFLFLIFQVCSSYFGKIWFLFPCLKCKYLPNLIDDTEMFGDDLCALGTRMIYRMSS